MNGTLMHSCQVEFVQVSLCVFFQDDSEDTKVLGVEDVQGSHASLTVPEQSLSTGSVASAGLEEEEPAVSSKELGDWLRQHPTYTMDMAGFTPVGSFKLLPLQGNNIIYIQAL